MVDAAVNDVLLKFEVGNAVTKQSANAVVLLIHGDRVAGAAQLLCSREACGTAANYSDALASSLFGRFRTNPSLIPAALDNGTLNELD